MQVWYVVLVFFASSLSYADSAIDTLFEFYDISPKTKKDIKTELQQYTPIINGGIKFHGSTSWQVKWQVSWKKTDDICYLDSSAATLKVLFTMPRISPEFTPSEEVLAAFNGYYSALLQHENGHMGNAKSALEHINMLLSNFNSYSDCQVLNDEVNNSIEKIVEKFKTKDKTYDVQTMHGKLQGVSIKKFL